MVPRSIARKSARSTRSAVLACVLLSVLLVAACTSSKSAPTKGTGTITVSLDRPITGGADATQTVESDGKTVSFEISEALVKLDANGQPQPGLATSWTASADGLTYTFKLRQGVTFQDGTPFNADAVVASLNRVFDPSDRYHGDGTYPYASDVPIKSVTKVDDQTVRVTASRFDPIFIKKMSLEPTRIQSPTAFAKWGKDYTNHAVGTGPFRLVSFNENTGATLQRYDNYWGTKPRFDKLVLQVTADKQAQVANLLSGSTDVVMRPPTAQLSQLKANPNLDVDEFPLRWLSDVVLNTSKAPFNDVRVRQAAMYAFDRDTLREKLNGNLTKAMNNVWYDGMPGFNPNVPQYPFDPTKAGQLLDQAGWIMPSGGSVREKDGKKLEITLVTAGQLTGFEAPVPTIFQQNMKAVGMKVDIKQIDPAVFFDGQRGVGNPANFNAAVLGWIARIPDPSVQFTLFLTQNFAPKGYNTSFYSNKQVDELFDKAQRTADDNARNDLYKQIAQIVMTDLPLLPDAQFTLPVAWNKKVSGFKVNGDGTIDFSGASVTG